MSEQQGDVLLFQTDDDGDIIVTDGIVEMSGGLETAAYLSFFGGNEDDDGRDGNEFEWWGNLLEVEDAPKYRSETQNLLQSIPATSSNLLRIDDATRRDLQWFIDVRAASEVTSETTMPGLNRVTIMAEINAFGEESEFTFAENWKASA